MADLRCTLGFHHDHDQPIVDRVVEHNGKHFKLTEYSSKCCRCERVHVFSTGWGSEVKVFYE